MQDKREDNADVIRALQHPARLGTRREVLERPSPVPAVAGIYGWHFVTAPAEQLDSNRLLYVGIAPRHMSNRNSIQSLRTRIRYHFRGNAAGSTLRLTLGCLLGLETQACRERAATELRRCRGGRAQCVDGGERSGVLVHVPHALDRRVRGHRSG